MSQYSKSPMIQWAVVALPALPTSVRDLPADTPWPVPYQELAHEAARRRERFRIPAAAADAVRTGLLLVDVQNTFCLPGFELFVGGRSGRAAIEDASRIASFICSGAGQLSGVVATLDTHRPAQLFHPCFLVDEQGTHPEPYTLITTDDLESGRWRFNRQLAVDLPIPPDAVDDYLLSYARRLETGRRYQWTIWPYHALLGTPGHSLVSAVEAALFLFGRMRQTQPRFVLKGEYPLTEHYSALGPEIAPPEAADEFTRRRRELVDELRRFDRLIVAGQAKSHCVAWTVRDLLENGFPAQRLYLLEDCTSPVVAGDLDFTDLADEAFEEFASAGAHVVESTTPMGEWPE